LKDREKFLIPTILQQGAKFMDNQNIVTVYNDCGEKIVIEKIGITKKGNFNFRVHHGDPLLDDEVTFTLPRKYIKDVSVKITLAFFIAGWVTGKSECDVIAKTILGMTKAQNSALGRDDTDIQLLGEREFYADRVKIK
jgi:hypothetical protein